ncbi:MAG: TetR/AcrR family transcriptional regulator C-terminal domain-containing protein [Lachnospiraceae bacterium]|nr:TetR/AcrR family transcriptional regulator C-terminal domain-containing protein [Lachnospiraceae bacterium]
MKQQITKNAIEAAFLKLLRERYFEKVMVKDIVEECGLTRNTFYYYYEDTYNIVEDITMREVERLIANMKPGDSFFDLASDTLEFFDENAMVAKHIFDSSKKEEIYRYIRSAMDVVIQKYIGMQDSAFARSYGSLSKDDKDRLSRICQYILHGMIGDWLSQGMTYSLKDEMYQLRDLYDIFMNRR